MSDATDSLPRQVDYFVHGDERGWAVELSGARYPYQTRRIALEAAVDAANTSGKRGHAARVLLRGNDGEWLSVWTYGLDPYPPLST